MKQGWEYRTIGEICKLKSGNSKANHSPLGDIPYVKVADMNLVGNEKIIALSSTYIDREYNISDIIPEGSVIFPKRGGAILTNKKRLTGRDICCDLNIMAVIPGEDIISSFLYYYFYTLDFTKLFNGAAIPQINNCDIAPLKIAVPSLAEQQRIVEYLDGAFVKIDALRANAARELQEAKALFQSALRDMMTPKEGWVEKTLPEISENLDYKRKPVTKGKRETGIYPYYGASGIVDYVSNYLLDEDVLLISEDGANLTARTTPIAFSVSGKVWVNNHAHILKFDNIATQRFVEYYFASIDISDYVTGAAQPKFSQKNMNILPVPYPPLPEQQRIVEHLDAISERVSALQKNYEQITQQCDALKQALLRQTFE